jgi:hypothetical protein
MDTTDNIIMIANVKQNALDWTPRELLIDALTRAREELPHVKKAIVIFFDETCPDPLNKIHWSQSGLTRLELLNVADMFKNSVLMDSIYPE